MALGKEAAAALEPHLHSALAHFSDILIATHSPPFVDACWYQGRAVVGEWTPHFTCIAMGELLSRVADNYPQSQIRVLCGHTHNRGYVRMKPNLEVYTGGATYQAPALQSPIDIR